MQRWNGWGEEDIYYNLPIKALSYLSKKLGPGIYKKSIQIQDISLPSSKLPDSPLIVKDPKVRLRYSHGQSFPDLVALRYGAFGLFSDGVAFPKNEEGIEDIFGFAKGINAQAIPFGGGTSVTGGVNPFPDRRPVLTVSLERMSRLLELDEKSLLATFEAGVRGPWLEAQLRAHGFTLGHFPQSFEYSSLGGWIATRSAGQQSLGYGRIEDLFAGGLVMTPSGNINLLPFPASAAGPDIRQIILGSEGRFGIVSSAIIRIQPLPEKESFFGMIFPTFRQGIEAVRHMVQEHIPLSMIRLSNQEETNISFMLSSSPYLTGLLEKALALFGLKEQKCMLLLAATGKKDTIQLAKAQSRAITKNERGIFLGSIPGKEWKKNRFRLAYLRNTLWDEGYAVDTLETATTWSKLLPTAKAIIKAIETALESENEYVLGMVHVSHVYQTGASLYFTFFFRLVPSADETIKRWQAIKEAASKMILRHNATISHHHGIGIDHKPYMQTEKGKTGMMLMSALQKALDPGNFLNPGKLFDK